MPRSVAPVPRASLAFWYSTLKPAPVEAVPLLVTVALKIVFVLIVAVVGVMEPVVRFMEPGALTVTVAFACAVVPLEPVQVSVYVVVVVGETLLLPLLTGVTEPTPWLMEAELLLLQVQERVEELPDVIEVGLAESDAVGPVAAGHEKFAPFAWSL